MNTRIEDTFSSLSRSMVHLARGWPFGRRTSPLTYAAIAGAGIATGVGIGMLLAPQSGKELRDDVARRARRARNMFGERLERATETLSEGVDAVASADERREAIGDEGGRARRSAHGPARA